MRELPTPTPRVLGRYDQVGCCAQAGRWLQHLKLLPGRQERHLYPPHARGAAGLLRATPSPPPDPSNAYRAVFLGQQFDASKPSHEENVSFRTEGFRMISRGGCSLAKIETHRRQIFAPELARGGTQVCTIDVETGAVTELTPAVEGR